MNAAFAFHEIDSPRDAASGLPTPDPTHPRSHGIENPPESEIHLDPDSVDAKQPHPWKRPFRQ